MIASTPSTNTSLVGDLCQGLVAGYSVRKLRQDYTGDCLQVRRNSDGTTQDIGFSNDVLDTGALLSFVGAGDGTVSIWYDQSATGENAVNTNPNTQPTIVSAGSLITQGGIPTLQMVGTTGLNNGQFLRILNPSYFDNNYNYAVFVTFHWNTSTSSDLVFYVNWTNSGNSNGNGTYVNASTGIGVFGRNAADSFIGVVNDKGPGRYIATAIYDREQGFLQGTVNSPGGYMGKNENYLFNPTTTRGAMIGARFNFGVSDPVDSNFMNGSVQEVLVFQPSIEEFDGFIRDNIQNYFF